jgi:hypothetical protein
MLQCKASSKAVALKLPLDLDNIFLASTVFRLALPNTQLSIRWVSSALSPGKKRSGRKADDSPLMLVAYKPISHVFMIWCLIS